MLSGERRLDSVCPGSGKNLTHDGTEHPLFFGDYILRDPNQRHQQLLLSFSIHLAVTGLAVHEYRCRLHHAACRHSIDLLAL